MKKLSLQWRITLMTALLICSTCMAMNWLIGCSGRHYMDSIGANLSTAIDPSEGAVEYFDPSREGLDPNLTIVIYGAQNSFTATNWYITAAVTLLGGILAYFVSGRALRPLRTFVAQVEKVQPNNLADMKITEEVLPEFRQFSDSFNQMLERLDEGFTAQRQFTGNAAHELRTPVANVSSQLEAIIEEVWEPTKERLQSCYDELGRISGIISDLEKLRQIEASNMVLEKEPVDLLELAQAVKTAFEPELAKKKLTCMVTGESAIISGDQKRLHQVIFNLVSNAVKYSTESGQILIDIHNLGKNVQLTVKDQGIGIAKEDIPLIFERFYRTDRSRNRKTGGAGIGLTIVKAIVLAHGGNISVESVKGCGSCFTVVLPKN